MKFTKMLALSALCSLCLAAVPGCDGGKTEAKPGDNKADAKGDAKADDKGEAKADAKTDVKADEKGDAKADDEGDAKALEKMPDEPPPTSIGVAECDEYIKKMGACFETDVIPADIREGQKKGFNMTVKSWADSAKEHPEKAPTLVTGCNAAMTAAKKMYAKCFE